MAWHQDYSYWTRTTPLAHLTCWIGLDDSKLSKSLGGIRRFSSLDLARIAEQCDVTVDWLVTGEEPALAMASRTTTRVARPPGGGAGRDTV